MAVCSLKSLWCCGGVGLVIAIVVGCIYLALGLPLMMLVFHLMVEYKFLFSDFSDPRSVEMGTVMSFMDAFEGMEYPEDPLEYRELTHQFFSSSMKRTPFGGNDLCPRVPSNVAHQSLIEFDSRTLDFLTVEWPEVVAPDDERVILYFHGGGFFSGHPLFYSEYLARLSRLTHATIYALNYGLVPEHPLPHAYEESLVAYQYLLTQYDSNSIVIGGDSAGGSIVFGLLQRAVERDIKLPSSAFAVSPWLDLSCSHLSIAEDHPTMKEMKDLLKMCLPPDPDDDDDDPSPADPKDPIYSPLFGSFEGFPPMFVAASQDEEFWGDGVAGVEKLREAGVEVETLFPNVGLPHVWVVMCAPEGIEDTAILARWVVQHWTVEQ